MATPEALVIAKPMRVWLLLKVTTLGTGTPLHVTVADSVVGRPTVTAPEGGVKAVPQDRALLRFDRAALATEPGEVSAFKH
ncbi:hypothetical protein [Streptomyces sp. NPDC055299]